MKHWISLLLLSASCVLATAQSAVEPEVINVYRNWEQSLKEKKADEHLENYFSGNVPISIVHKDSLGPVLLGHFTATMFTGFWKDSEPMELRISDIRVHEQAGLAISNARFDEFIDGEFSAHGRDMFGYINTEKGWKLLFMHNTVVIEPDTSAAPVSNQVLEVVSSLEAAYSKNEPGALGGIFFAPSSQFLALRSTEAAGPNQVGNVETLVQEMADTPATLQFSNHSIHYVDQYLATIFCDYARSDGKASESGQAMISLLADQRGWSITNLVLQQTDQSRNTP